MTRHPFDLLEFPLDGMRLIEASAGTGKTFNLAGLYLRLLVEKHLDVRQILVMTFTRAATQELRERIRRHLAEAARLAASPHDVRAADSEQASALKIIERAAAQEPRERIAQRLRDAATRMDDATISTIHAFAQRAAQENAFESGQPFDQGTQIDDRKVRDEAIFDYWRSQTIGHDADQTDAFLTLWPDPTALARDLKPLLDRPHVAIWGATDAEIDGLIHAARAAWATGAGDLLELLERATAQRHWLKTSSLGRIIDAAGGAAVVLNRLAAALSGTVSGQVALPLWVIDLASASGARQHFKKATKADAKNPIPDYRTQDLAVVQHLAKLAQAGRGGARRSACNAIRASIRQRKQAGRQFSFADMIEGLHEAVTDEARGAALAEALHHNWPYALVDEFQDTDPLQYEILRRTYQGRDRGALFMIGDPKQAIYGFRGGDVYAYLAAARDADGCYELDTNFRSTRGVLDGIEALFLGPAEKTPAGSFLVSDIRFTRVGSGRKDGVVLQQQGKALAPITVWSLDDDEYSAESGRRRLLDATVAEICTLLDPALGARRCDADGSERAVVPADIAVLVNTNDEAAAVQRALAQQGVAAVCLQRASVFASDEAKHLLYLLRAVADSARSSAIRAALVTPLFGLRMGDLLALAADEAAWQRQVAQIQDANEVWRNRGLLALLEPLLQAAAPRVLALADGERRMTNYLHLAELLAGAETETFGVAGLIRWLGEQIQAPDDTNAAEARQLRLESDDALVRIVTVHRVKGLQYPIVFIPFTATLGPRQPRAGSPGIFHDQAGRGWIEYGESETDNRGAATLEARAESLRLLYVALTRAEQACYVGWGTIRTAQNSALAWLLHADDITEPWHLQGAQAHLPPWLSATSIRAQLSDWSARAPGSVRVTAPPAALAAGQRSAQDSTPLGSARTDLPARRRSWSVHSFSRLVAGGAHRVPGSGLDDEFGQSQSGNTAAASESPIRRMLRGPTFGSAVHQLLESLDPAAWPPPGAAHAAHETDRIARALANAGLSLGAEPTRTVLLNYVADLITLTLHTPLPHIGRLAAVPSSRRLVEMEFFLRLGGKGLGHVIDFMTAHGYGVGLPRDRHSLLLNGLMQGFIDLIVEADGRYWILDYKTNDLGSGPTAYHEAGLRQAVTEGHYDLQYLIYLVALHRHLDRTLPDYDPQVHLGGAQYLFLRGLNGRDASTGVFVDRPDTAFLIGLDALFAGTEGK